VSQDQEDGEPRDLDDDLGGDLPRDATRGCSFQINWLC